MDLRLNNIYFEVRDLSKKAGIRKPKVIVKYEVPIFQTETVRFNDVGVLSFSSTNIRLRPHRCKPILVSANLSGSFNPFTGDVKVEANCTHNAVPNISVRVVGYDLVSVRSNYN